MQIPIKKLNNGFEISELGFGTWEMGGRFEKEENYDEEKDIRAIQKATELGFNRFDTAEVYADGYAEEILGKAINGFDGGKLFITSKVYKTHLKYDDVLRSCEGSLKRLGLSGFIFNSCA
jgi:diketogulonate reductase-like aldo/keto reductase